MKDVAGSQWLRIDFHAHSPASKDFDCGGVGQRDLMAHEWIKSAMQAGLDAIVVTDHNIGEYVGPLRDALMRIASKRPNWYRPLTVFPGVEITVADAGSRIHVLAVLDSGSERRVSSLDSSWYIVPLCSGCNQLEDEFELKCEVNPVKVNP